jgi:hypothetical protein
VYEGALEDLRRQGGAGYRLRTTDEARALSVVRELPGLEHVVAGEHGLSFQAEEQRVGALSLALGHAGVGILALTPELATLEDLFFRLTENGDGGDDDVPSDAYGDPQGMDTSARVLSSRGASSRS